MCGFLVDYKGKNIYCDFEDSLRYMMHRGQDGNGLYFVEDLELRFGHVRLAIIDPLSSTQPFISHNGDYVIVFNGEILNFVELRSDLKKLGYCFQTNGDTEVLLNLYIEYKEACVYKLSGMFSFVILDTRKKLIFTARDHFGVKPLYYYQGSDSEWVISSDINTLKYHLRKSHLEINYKSLGDFIFNGYVIQPETIYNNIYQFEPGTYTNIISGHFTTVRYWNLRDECLKKLDINRGYSFNNSIEIVRSALDESIKLNFTSDVPVGIFFSGGLDSSALVASAQSMNLPLGPLMIADFGERKSVYSEFSTAKLHSDHFGLDLLRYDISDTDLRSKLFLYLDLLGNPTVDGLNTYLISNFAASNGVKVSLSGVGADELFGGYDFFYDTNGSKFQKTESSNNSIRRIQRSLLWRYLPFRLQRTIERFFTGDLFYLTKRRSFLLNEEMYDLINFMHLEKLIDLEEIFDRNYSMIKALRVEQFDRFNQISFIEIETYLKNCLLPDTDLSSMACGVEVRPPFLNHEFVSTVLAMPSRHKANSNLQKEILRLAYSTELPSDLLRRSKKHGFNLPIREILSEKNKHPYNYHLEIISRFLKQQ